MPSSHCYQINEIVELILLTNPKNVLDIGVGFGKYGFLAREYLELWNGREKYNDWQRHIDGIESFKDYITPVHKFIYNNIYIGNAKDIIPNLKTKYDLALLIDIIEHSDHENGMRLVKDSLKVSRNILISTPKNIGVQKDFFCNPNEDHIFQFKKKHFAQFKKKFFVPNKDSLLCFIGEDAPKIKKTIIKIKIARWFPFLRDIHLLLKNTLLRIT